MITLQNNLKIAVGSKNPVKINAVKEAFEKLGFPNVMIDGIDDHEMRGVDHQPLTKESTAQGAFNRAKYCLERNCNLDMALGLEGGVFFDDKKEKSYLFGVVVVIDKKGYENCAFSGDLLLPNILRDMLLGGAELGDAMDKIIRTQNIKQGQGTTGFLMGGVIDRQTGFMINTAQALVPWIHKNKGWY